MSLQFFCSWAWNGSYVFVNSGWCDKSIYGAYHSCQFLAPHTTWFLIYGYKYFLYFTKNGLMRVTKSAITHQCYYFKTKFSVIKEYRLTL